MTLKSELQDSLFQRGLTYLLLGWLGVLAYIMLILPEPSSAASEFIFEEGSWYTVGIGFAVTFISAWLAHAVSDHKPGSIRVPHELPHIFLGPLLACGSFIFTLAFGLKFIALNGTTADILPLALRTASVLIIPWPAGVVVFLICLLIYYSLR